MLVQARFVSSVTEADKIIKSHGVSVNAVASGDEIAGCRSGAQTRTRRIHRSRRKEVQARNASEMLLNSDNVAQSIASLRAHKLRTVLTVVGLTMGVATLITVMTIVQGANLYVEKKIANLGTDVFQVARTPFAATDFNVVIKALKNKHIELEDLKAVQENCVACKAVGATGNTTAKRSLRRQRTRRCEHLRAHAEHGGYRYANRVAGPVLHGLRKRPFGAAFV